MGEQITDLAELLSDETDALSELFLDAATEIRRLQVGVAARVPMGDGQHHLTYQKVGREWLLGVSQNGSNFVAISSASRALRLSAASLLPELFQTLVDNLEHEITAVTNAQREVETFLEFVKQLSPRRHTDA